MDYNLLVINPGSSSTKIAVYKNETAILKHIIKHIDLSQYKNIFEQLPMRKKAIIDFLEKSGYSPDFFSAIAVRGGILPPVDAGAYVVNHAMVELIKSGALIEHASNLGALIAYDLTKKANIKAYIYDAVSTDQLDEIARISGMAALPRRSNFHALNSRAVAAKIAKSMERQYNECTFIVCHMGGGISLSIHKKGRVVDLIADDEGPFSPERAGKVPCMDLIKLCFSETYDYQKLSQMLRGNGGLIAYLGTSDGEEIVSRINSGDDKAELLFKAMAYQIAKGIGELSTVVSGKVDSIILTGGLAASPLLTRWIKKRTEFIAPVRVVAGEYEMEALALGILKVLRNEEKANEFIYSFTP